MCRYYYYKPKRRWYNASLSPRTWLEVQLYGLFAVAEAETAEVSLILTPTRIKFSSSEGDDSERFQSPFSASFSGSFDPFYVVTAGSIRRNSFVGSPFTPIRSSTPQPTNICTISEPILEMSS